jgi:carbamate kinase
MAAKRPRKFSKNKQVKAIARKQVGSPAPSRILDERSIRTKPKHKENWLKETDK